MAPTLGRLQRYTAWKVQQTQVTRSKNDSLTVCPETQDEAVAAAAAGMLQAMDNEPSYGIGWDCMTEPVMQIIVHKLDTRSQQLCRLVSRHWNYFFTNNLQVS